MTLTPLLLAYVQLHVAECHRGIQAKAAEEEKQKQLPPLATLTFMQALKHSAVYDLMT